MKPRFRTWLWFHVTVAGLTLAGLGGCASVAPKADAEPPLAAAAAQLRKGMKPDEVRQLLGNPERVQPMSAAEVTAERWVYPGARRTVVRQVATSTQEVPYFDPITNQMRTVPEPVYSDEALTIVDELHLLWVNGELAEWKIEQRTTRSYTR